MRVPAPPIVTCPQWDARPPASPPLQAGTPRLCVIHHTAGLGPAGIGAAPPAALEAGKAYAQALQRLHMDVNGWNDSGHSFLVMRSGVVLQGRWGTVTAIEHGRMVISAHCPGENDQPGIEHEHVAGPMPAAQLEASAQLLAWICDRTGVRPTQLYGHSHFFPTACPAALGAQIPQLRLRTAAILTGWHNRPEV